MNQEQANSVYDILVTEGDADETMRESFLYYHAEDNKKSKNEWRFGGKLGFGGKYRSETNTVDCYSEDENQMRVRLITKINNLLEAVLTKNNVEK